MHASWPADDDGPKYLNTPETLLFKKSAVLYGADMAKRDIAQRRQAVLVEGYTDVMACHLAGITTAIATSGTSFGDGHITILRRLLMDESQFRGEVIFTFDGDAAGQRAALRAFSMEERFVTQTFVAVQADGLDPCDLRLERGDAAVRDLIAQRVPLFEFAIRSALHDYNLETAEGKLAALDAAAPIVGRIKDKGLRHLYAVSLDRWLGMMDETFVVDRVLAHSGQPDRTGPGRRPAASVRRRPGRARGGTQAGSGGPGREDTVTRNGAESGQSRPGQSQQPRSAYDQHDPIVNVERQALKLAIQRPALCGPAFDELPPAIFTVSAHAAVCELIASCGGVASARSARGVDGTAARRCAERQCARVRHEAGGRANRGARRDRRARRQVRRGRACPGRGTGGQPRNREHQVPAAAPEPGRRAGRLQPHVRRPRGARAATKVLSERAGGHAVGTRSRVLRYLPLW